MSTQFCAKCKGSHPGRVCDYDDQGECAETSEPETRPDEPSSDSPRNSAAGQRPRSPQKGA